jgi:hypothetical protein
MRRTLKRRPSPQVARAPAGPGYWMNEQSGKLKPAVLAYLKGERLDDVQIGWIRAYLQQWIDSPMWQDRPGCDTVILLRSSVDAIHDRASIRDWLDFALTANIDPL